MVCNGLASVAVHGFDVPGVGDALPLWSCCGSSADGAAEIADGRPLSPVLAWPMFHGRSQYSTAHACKMSCVVIKCVIWCKCVLICELRKGDGKGGDMMYYVLWFVVLFLSFVVGVFGFCQIIGSIQTRQRAFLLTIVIWGAILVGGYFIVRRFLPNQMIALYVGYGISLLKSLTAGKIQ